MDVSEEKRYWVVGAGLGHIMVGRYEWGRPSLLGKFPSAHGIMDPDALSEAMTCIVRDYVKITAPAGCRNAVERFELEAPSRYGERVALAFLQTPALHGGGTKIPESGVKMLVDAMLCRPFVEEKP